MDNWLKRHLSSPIINYWGAKKVKRHFTKAPIFIGGCGRSGTTLLLSILSAHPSIFAIPYETDAFTSWENRADSLYPKRLDRFHRAILMGTIKPMNKRWCEKRPDNVNYISEILTYFGSEARFIHIVRDPRAVCTSLHPSRKDQYWIPPERYINDVSAGLKFQEHPQVLTIRYEDLVQDFNKSIKSICEFIGESLQTEVIDWHQNATVKFNKALEGRIQKLHDQSLIKWKEPKHTAQIDQILNHRQMLNLMNRLGYMA